MLCLSEIDEEQYEHKEIPHALIEESGLMPFFHEIYIYTIREPLQGRIRDQVSVSLLICKIAPSADSLSEYQPYSPDIQDISERHLAVFMKDDRAYHRTYNSSVDSYASLPYIKSGYRI